MMRNQNLLTPGPLSLVECVKRQMLYDAGSRDLQFKKITRELRAKILEVSGLKESHSVVPLQGSGTFVIEAALLSLVTPQDKILLCINGDYSRRIKNILERNRFRFEFLSFKNDEQVSVDIVERKLRECPGITHLCFVHCETTLGIMNPYDVLIECSRKFGIVSIVDSMSAFGAVPVDCSHGGVDILISSGNKCVEAPPGVAFAIVRTEILEHAKPEERAGYCLNLVDQWARFELDGEWRFTPPTHTVQAFNKALELLLKEGISARYHRYMRLQEEIVARLGVLGFIPVLDEHLRAPVCVSFTAPAIIANDYDFSNYYNHLAKYNLYIYSKFDNATLSFRVGCIGQINRRLVDRFIAATSEYVEKRLYYIKQNKAVHVAPVIGAQDMMI